MKKKNSPSSPTKTKPEVSRPEVNLSQDDYYQSGKQIFPEEKEFKIGD